MRGDIAAAIYQFTHQHCIDLPVIRQLLLQITYEDKTVTILQLMLLHHVISCNVCGNMMITLQIMLLRHVIICIGSTAPSSLQYRARRSCSPICGRRRLRSEGAT